MRDFLEDNGGDLLAGVIALLIAFITVWTAEGGRDRRTLKHLKEEFEVYELAVRDEEYKLLAESLRNDIQERANRYVFRGGRRSQYVDSAWAAILFAGFLYLLFDIWSAVARDTDLTTAGALLLALYLFLAAGAALICVVIGLFRLGRWAWSRR